MTPDGRVVAIEVKAGATVRAEDLAGLHHIAQRLGSRLMAGYVFHTAQQILPPDARAPVTLGRCQDHEPLCRDGGRNQGVRAGSSWGGSGRAAQPC
jgi:hypothetical protein